ncbi:uncharacterized membrane protein YhaH (DUF805 family) [Pedobacter cryoconitis]|uniref:Uncharacterized membrane protein YhaH (DUF805 family) n=1 Tax=Pedobacter cryoconitis TaxID=188932 RepID=A0A7W9DXK1_9SPHI|nr:tryptophan-rich sensory protein [Pedobacter cryoconitis]MBB5635018.1 uncharacterized membrane protein YhaH (DUF805 family) [Pedobacter cryoconitis]MBB6271798.1 uncharacterized membrane protein YhaH (DUF805 family) [Pedobacter cryoconitis]
MKKILSIANGIALIVTILINYLSNAGILNGNTMKTVSDKYFNYFTPAGYAFSIWGLIYLGLLGFAFYSWRNLLKEKEEDSILLKIGWWFVLSCCANSLWVIAWLYDYTGLSVLIMAFLLISLLKIIINTRMELDAQPFKKYLFVFWPFALYSGWISVALIANIAAFLTKVNWSGWGISNVTWTIIMICVAGLINIFMISVRNLREYGVVGIWALLAISVSNTHTNGSTAVAYTCYIVAVILLVFIGISGLKNRDSSFEKM